MGAALIAVLLGFGALAAGILIGRYYVPDDRMLKRTARNAKSYMRAVNYLLARDKDSAVNELTKVVSENVEDIEPYFALGALFRSRGEWERAIRVHQAIALREAASKKLRLRAKYELGLDFRSAGMPRRATRAMEEVLGEESRHEGALRALCGLYEEQGRYAEAASAWKRLHKLRGGPPSSREHHLLVAAAQQATSAGDFDSAKRLLRDAQRIDEHSPHLLAAAAELAAAKGNHKGAVARLEQALEAAPELAPYLVPGLEEAHRHLLPKGEDAGKDGDDSGDDEEVRVARRAATSLDKVLQAVGTDPHLELAVAEVRSHYDPTAALDDYRHAADEHPDLLPARVAAARLALAAGDADAIRSELHLLAAADGSLSWATDSSWRCRHCGHRDESFTWRCRQCRRWGTMRLDIGREALEVPPPPPRERRERPRVHVAALLGAASESALPEPTLESGLSDDELVRAGRRPSFLGRVGSWFSGLRGKKGDQPKRLTGKSGD